MAPRRLLESSFTATFILLKFKVQKSVQQLVQKFVKKSVKKSVKNSVQKSVKKSCQKFYPRFCPKTYPKICPKICPKTCPKTCLKTCPKICSKIKISKRIKGISFFEYQKGPKMLFQQTPCEGTVVVGVRNHHCQIYSSTQTHIGQTDRRLQWICYVGMSTSPWSTLHQCSA